MRILAVLLAAGAGRRIGGGKALLAPNGRSFLERCAARLSVRGVSGAIAVVRGDDAAVTRLAAALPGVERVAAPPTGAGMLGSILAGLARAEERRAEAILVHPVDHPTVDPATVARVVAALEGGAAIAVPSSSGRRGHPAGFSAAVWPDLRRARPERGAREVLALRSGDIVHVEGDPGCRVGIDTPEDYRRVFENDPVWLTADRRPTPRRRGSAGPGWRR